MRCLAKDPDHRPGQASDWFVLLDTVYSSGASTAAPAILLPDSCRTRAGVVGRRDGGGRHGMGSDRGRRVAELGAAGTAGVMLAGLPAITFTAWVQRRPRSR